MRKEYATAAIQKIQKYGTRLRQGYGVARHGTGYWTATDDYILAETDEDEIRQESRVRSEG